MEDRCIKGGRTILKNKLITKAYPLYFVLPSSLIYLALFIIPFFLAVFYSFTDWNMFDYKFNGLENFKNILLNSELNISVINTFVFAIVTTVLKVICGLALAILLNRQLKTKSFLRSIFFLPAVINNVAVGILFISLLHPTTGLVNKFLHAIGANFLALDWLVDTRIAIFSASMVEVWKYSGFCMVIFLAALQAISSDYYEAANIDGASGWQKFKNITFPLIMPAFNNVLVLSIKGGLKVFDIILATTGGGPGNATSVLNIMIYHSFGSNMYGEACAGSTMLAVVVAVIALVVYKTISKLEVEM
jgi:raffinose/stachyose/melibiose transport system permease protein